MGRVLAIDYGLKRTGLAVTDPLKIIATPLETIDTSRLLAFLKDYLATEKVEGIVIGMPKDLKNLATHSTESVKLFVNKLHQQFPNLPIHEIDERFTSKMAFQSMIDGGLKKKARKNKATIDKLSATIVLQSFLESKSTG